MWTGVRMMSRWAIEFGFYMAGVFSGGEAFIDPAGRPLSEVVWLKIHYVFYEGVRFHLFQDHPHVSQRLKRC